MDEAEADEQVLFIFALGGNDPEDDTGSLLVLGEDARLLLKAASVTRLERREPEEVLAVCRKHCDNLGVSQATVTRLAFQSCIRALVPRKSLTKVERELLSSLINDSFDVLVALATAEDAEELACRNGTNGVSAIAHRRPEKVPLTHLACALSIMCAGSKSAKLAFVFRMMDTDGDGLLSLRELQRLFAVSLVSLCAATGHGSDLLPADVAAAALRTGTDATNLLRSALRNPTDGPTVAFETFGEWYNAGGFQRVPWLELLGLRKWAHALGNITAAATGGPPGVTAETAGATAAETAGETAPARAAGDAAAAVNGEDRGGGGQPAAAAAAAALAPGAAAAAAEVRPAETLAAADRIAFEFVMGPDDVKFMRLALSDQDVESLLDLVAGTGLSERSCSDVGAIVIAAAAEAAAQAEAEVANNVANANAVGGDGGGSGGADDAEDDGSESREERSFRAARRLPKAVFDRCMRRLVPAERLTAQQRGAFSQLLSHFHAAFVPLGRRVEADVIELAAGLSLLCGGNKSEKLAYAFDLVSRDAAAAAAAGVDLGGGRVNGGGCSSGETLNRNRLEKFLRGVLAALWGLSASGMARSIPERGACISRGSAWAVEKAYRDLRLDYHSHISFDQFASWYTNGGYRTIPWVELLDLRKWAATAAAAAAPAAPAAAAAAAASAVTSDVEVAPSGPAAAAGSGGGRVASSAAATAAAGCVDAPGSGETEADTDEEFVEDSDYLTDENITDTDDDSAAPANAAGANSGPQPVVAGAAAAAPPLPQLLQQRSGDEVPLFTIPMGEGLQLMVYQEDVDRVGQLAVNARLASHDPEDVAEAFSRLRNASRDSPPPPGTMVSRAEFDASLGALLFRQDGAGFGASALGAALGGVFAAYDRRHAGLVPLRDLLAGLTFLCSGSKSKKLAFVFELFVKEQGEEGGRISRRAVRDFVAVLLAGLCACVRQMRQLTTGELWTVIDLTADLANRAIFRDTASQFHGRPGLSFEEFGDFYNSGGFEVIPWLELLDLSKWIPLVSAQPPAPGLLPSPRGNGNGTTFFGRGNIVTRAAAATAAAGGGNFVAGAAAATAAAGGGNFVAGAAAAAGAAAGGDDGRNDGGASYGLARSIGSEGGAGGGSYSGGSHSGRKGSGGSAKARFLLKVCDTPEPLLIVLAEQHLAAAVGMATETGILSMLPNDLCPPMIAAATDGVLGRDTFLARLKRLSPQSMAPHPQRSRYTLLLTSIFTAFDRDNRAAVDAVELSVGLTIFCRGGRAAKIAFAFHIFDEDHDGYISRRTLWRLMRSFLTALLVSSHAASTLSAEAITRAADDGAVWTAARIFVAAEIEKPNKISLMEFERWYKARGGGAGMSPWLELLDFDHWR